MLGELRLGVFDRYTNFISKDMRTDRPTYNGLYTVDANLMEYRHECFFSNICLKGKSVLDIGSCVGATGAWVLDKGASYYHGVEYTPYLCDIAKENFQQYFPKKNWQITCASMENFLIDNTFNYDVVIVAGVLHGLGSPSLICRSLESIFNFAQYCIVESSHPRLEGVNVIPKIIENESFISFGTSSMGDYQNKRQVEYLTSIPSMGFIKRYSSAFGFESTNNVYELLKNRCSVVYNPRGRYCVQLSKIGVKQSIGFANAMQNDNQIKAVDWQHIK